MSDDSCAYFVGKGEYCGIGYVACNSGQRGTDSVKSGAVSPACKITIVLCRRGMCGNRTRYNLLLADKRTVVIFPCYDGVGYKFDINGYILCRHCKSTSFYRARIYGVFL